MLVVILNNNTQHPIPITDSLYDYLASTVTFNNHNIIDWTNELLTYLNSIKNTTITSIIVKNDDTVLRSYSNLEGQISTVNEFIGTDDQGIVSATLSINIFLPDGIQNN